MACAPLITEALMPLTNRLLIQVVAQLNPARSGVSDHAISLAQELHTGFGIDTAFVVLNSNERCDLPYPCVYCAPSELVKACLTLSEGQPGTLLVHLSGYGYSADGAPTLLADALASVRKSGRFRIAVFFHELYATGMPWKKAFWYSHRQRKAICRIADICDLLLTNTRYHADWLEQKSLRKSNAPVQLLPVFSCAGEVQEPGPYVLREPAMAVFGLEDSRRRAYKRLANLASTLKGLGVREIVDVGPEFAAPSALCGIPVRRTGALAAADLAVLFSRIQFGFVPHPTAHLAKSGILACYCVHGVIPVVADPFTDEVDGLRDGVQLLSPKTAIHAEESCLESCSAAACRWYSEHRLHLHAATYARWLLQQPSEAKSAMGPLAK
jgi:hypothetical protein